MKSKILTGLLVLIVLKSMAQSTEIAVHHNEKTIGRNLQSQNEIKADENIFPKRIHEFYVDSISGYVTLELRKLSKNGKVLDLSGTILEYGLNSKNTKWSKKIDYSVSRFDQYNNIIIQTKGNKISSQNIENGETLWETKNDLYFVNSMHKIGVGYQNKGLTGNLNTLAGINLVDGTTIWERELNREYGWNKITQLNDSILMIAAAGLHTINIKNGKGWGYNTVTGKKDYTETIAKNVAGIALGVLTGTAIISSGNNLVRDLLSNEVIENDDIYFASKEEIIRLNKLSGEIIWSYSLPNHQTSKSSIFVKDSLLYMINKGYAFWGNKRIDFGEPFMMALNKDNGKQQYFILLNQKKNPILDFKVKNDDIVLVFKDRIEKYSLLNGAEIFSKTFNIDELGELKFFIGNRIYRDKKNLELSNLASSDTTKFYVQTSKGKTLELDNEFTITNQFDFEYLYFHYLTHNDYKFLIKGNQTVILNKDNQMIAELQVSDKSRIIRNKLYDIIENSLLVVDLSGLTKN